MRDWTWVRRVLGADGWCKERDCVWEWPGPGLSTAYWLITERTALCEIPFGLDEDGSESPCQIIATLDASGRHVCPDHWARLWYCAGCGAWLPEGRSGYCSPACTWADHATQTWLGQRLGARYTTREGPTPA